MDADARIREPSTAASEVDSPPEVAFAPDASVVLLRPKRLSGTIGVLKRRLAAGWEVEIRSTQGTPMHLTLPERALYLR